MTLCSRSTGSTARGGVIGPTFASLTMADLPSPSTVRWVAHRKAEIVAAVLGGLLTPDEACARYSLTMDEFLGWRRAMEFHGIDGLRVTRIRQYRQARGRHRASFKTPALSG
jgi:Protein of unknown function (DUF1153)